LERAISKGRLTNRPYKSLKILELIMNKKNIENIYPMTPMQQGILFHTLNAPQTGVYVIQNGYQFNSKINISAFKKAWQQVINTSSQKSLKT
jgi:hypothetical protein